MDTFPVSALLLPLSSRTDAVQPGTRVSFYEGERVRQGTVLEIRMVEVSTIVFTFIGTDCGFTQHMHVAVIRVDGSPTTVTIP